MVLQAHSIEGGVIEDNISREMRDVDMAKVVLILKMGRLI